MQLDVVATNDLQREISRREYRRRQLVKDSVVHRDMTLSEVYQSLKREGFIAYCTFEDSVPRGNYYRYSDSLSFCISLLKCFNVECLYISYNDEEFIKPHLECWVSDILLGDFIEFNEWVDE